MVKRKPKKMESDSSDSDSSGDESSVGNPNNPNGLPDAEEEEATDNHDYSLPFLPMQTVMYQGNQALLIKGGSREMISELVLILCGTCKSVLRICSWASHCTKCKKKRPVTKRRKFSHYTGVLDFQNGGNPVRIDAFPREVPPLIEGQGALNQVSSMTLVTGYQVTDIN